MLRPFPRSAAPAAARTLTVPARLNGLLLTGLLGKGGMGAVYQALDESLGRRVAVKVMLKVLGEDKKSIETFRKEAQAAAALNHPNIAQIHVFGEEKGQPYIVMELLTGGRLDQMIAKKESLDELAVLKIGMGVAEGLKAANDIGLVHGDIKPENVLLDASGVAKVVDFGLASFLDKSPQTEGSVGNAVLHCPRKSEGPAGRRAIGHLQPGRHLVPSADGPASVRRRRLPWDVIRARLEQPPPKLSALRPGVNPGVESLVTRMLQPEPAMRYPTYASLLADMRKLLETLPAKQKITLQSKTTGKAPLVISPADLSSYRKRLQGQPVKPAAATPKKSRAFRATVWVIVALAASREACSEFCSTGDGEPARRPRRPSRKRSGRN